MNDIIATAERATRCLHIVLSQGQSQNPVKKQLENEIVSQLLERTDLDVLVIPNLYDLSADGPSLSRLRELEGDLVVLSWLYERASHWILDRNGVRGEKGPTLLEQHGSDEDDEESNAGDGESSAESDGDKQRVVDLRERPTRTIYCLDLRVKNEPAAFVQEVLRIQESYEKPSALRQWIQGTPRPDQMQRYLSGERAGGPRQPTLLDDNPARRWYPVIDYSRCTNCMECIDFCLFGVYGVDRVETILVEQPDNCRKGCPACSRVCPENAIIFPQHKTPAIAGAPAETGGSLKIDLSQLFGAPSAIEIAAQERDEQLVAVGRDAVGLSVGIPKRQADKPDGPADELDSLIDQLDGLDL